MDPIITSSSDLIFFVDDSAIGVDVTSLGRLPAVCAVALAGDTAPSFTAISSSMACSSEAAVREDPRSISGGQVVCADISPGNVLVVSCGVLSLGVGMEADQERCDIGEGRKAESKTTAQTKRTIPKTQKKEKGRPGLNADVTCNWRQGMLVTMARDLGTHLTSETARTGQGPTDRRQRSRGKPTETNGAQSPPTDQPYCYKSLSLWGLRCLHDKSL